MGDMLIKDGTVVDGTGAEPFAADVRVRDGVIAEVGPDLEAQDGERVFDAKGCYVTPGLIESHTHYDASMWWQPDLDPLPGHGCTTMIMGNCGFTAAPLHDTKEAQSEMINIFSFFEDIPVHLFHEHVPWDWRKWSDYRKSMESNVKVPLNYASYVGHIAIRLAAMGMDAWERAATPEEIEKMCELLDDAMAAGALGLSDNLHDHDGSDRPVPSMLADDAEFEALFKVLEKYPAACYQVIVDTFMRMTGPDNMKRLEKMLEGSSIRIQVAGAVPTLDFQAGILPAMQASVDSMREAGVDIWPGYSHMSPTQTIGLVKSLIFAQSNDYVWHEVVLEEDHDKKRELLSDPDWRERARESWDTKTWEHSPFQNPQDLYLLDSENGTGPINCTLKDYADELGVHRSDAMAEWILANGTKSTVHMAPFPKNEELTVELMRDPKTVGNITDAGAHLQMFCGGGDNAPMLTSYVRDKKRISIAEAIHVMTGKLAEHFFLPDRGVIAEGKRADIVVFDLDEIQYNQMEKAYDMDDGHGGKTWRFTRPAMPTRLTMVNGEATFENGEYTGAKPGEFLAPVNDNVDAALEAAE
ncbi:MAG: D-aminoacylase [Pseudomonadota bacterium]